MPANAQITREAAQAVKFGTFSTVQVECVSILCITVVRQEIRIASTVCINASRFVAKGLILKLVSKYAIDVNYSTVLACERCDIRTSICTSISKYTYVCECRKGYLKTKQGECIGKF